MWISLKKIIPLTINKFNFKGQIDKIKAFKNWNNYINNKRFQYKILPVLFKNGILTVQCDNPIIINEFYLRKEEILKEINKKEKIINNLKFVYY